MGTTTILALALIGVATLGAVLCFRLVAVVVSPSGGRSHSGRRSG